MRKRQDYHDNKIEPTPERERQAHAGIIETDELLSEGGERVVVERTRKAESTIERLYRDERITDEEKDAAGDYYKDWYFGTMPSQVIPRYSEYISQSYYGVHGDAAVRRAYHYNRYEKARVGLGPELERVADAFILEIPLPGHVKPLTLREAGQLWSGYRVKARAEGYAVGQLSAVLYALKCFYRGRKR